MIRDIAERQDMQERLRHHKHKTDPWWVFSKTWYPEEKNRKSHFIGDKCITVMWNWIGADRAAAAIATGPRSALQKHLNNRGFSQRGRLNDQRLSSSSVSVCIFISVMKKCHVTSHHVICDYQILSGRHYILMFLLSTSLGQPLMLLLALNLWNVLISSWSSCHILLSKHYALTNLLLFYSWHSWKKTMFTFLIWVVYIFIYYVSWIMFPFSTPVF